MNQSADRQDAPLSRLAIIASFATMFMLGSGISLLGPSLPGLAQRSGLELGEAGLLFTLFSGGSVVATVVLARLMDRPIRHQLLIAGSIVLAGAFWWISASQSPLGVRAAIALSGLALSTVGTAPNAIVADAFQHRSGQALNALHVAAGAGSFVGPLLVSAGIRAGRGYPFAYQVSSGVMLLVALLWTVSRPPVPHRQAAHTGHVRRVMLLRGLGLLLLMGFLYTGAEQTIGGWLFTFTTVAAKFEPSSASVVTAVFWGFILVGRLAAARILAKTTSTALIQMSVMLAVLGVLCIVGGVRSWFLLWIGVGLIGLGFGPIFPTLLALAAQTFRHRSGMSSSLIIASGSIGTMLLPLAGGALIPLFGINASMAATIVPILLLLAVLRIFSRVSSR